MADFSHIGGRQIKKINIKRKKNNKHIHFIKKSKKKREKGTCTYTYLKQTNK